MTETTPAAVTDGTPAEYEPGELYEDSSGYRYLRLPPTPQYVSPWYIIHRGGTVERRPEGYPLEPLRKLVPEGAPPVAAALDRAERAEAKLAAIEEKCRKHAEWANLHCPDLGMPAEALVKAADILAIIGSEEGEDRA